MRPSFVQHISAVGCYSASGLDANFVRSIFGQVEHLRLPSWPEDAARQRLGRAARRLRREQGAFNCGGVMAMLH